MSPVVLKKLADAGITTDDDAQARDIVERFVDEPEKSQLLRAIADTGRPPEHIPREDYDKIDAVNISTLKSMAVSPRHYQHALSTPRADTDSMRLGRLMHAMVFESETIDDHWEVWDSGRRAGKEWEAFLARSKGKEILRAPEDWAAAEAVAAAVQAHPIAARYLREGKPEQTIRWTDATTNIACKGRADWITPGGVIVDLKTTRDISPRTVARQLVALSYHAQAAFYCDGAEATTHWSHGFAWIYVEQKPPYDVAVYTCPTDVLSAGRDLYLTWLRRVAQCRDNGTWPGVAPDELEMSLPAWALAEPTAEFGLTINGQEVTL